VGLKIEGRGFAGTKEERDVFHLYERHHSLGLKSKCIWDCEIDQLAKSHPIFKTIQQVTRSEALS